MHSGSNATFRVQVQPNVTYDVRVYMANPKRYGIYEYHYGNFDVKLEGVTAVHIESIAPGTIAVRDPSSAGAMRVTPSDGVLDIQFIGYSGNWVVSGIEIATVGGLGTAINYLTADESQAVTSGGVMIDDAMLAPLVAEAAARWSAADLTPAQLAALSDLHVGVADLTGSTLGLAYQTTNEIRIDNDAAGWGWSVIGDRSSVIGAEWAVIGDRWSPITDHRSPVWT